jgi:uncharacterized membrane protein YfcA
MENVTLTILPLIGAVGGFLSGLLGLGGGVIILPLLTFIGRIPFKLATGTGLVHVVVASATGMFFHYRKGMVDLNAGLYLGIAGIGGGFLGTYLSVLLEVQYLQSVYLFVVILAVLVLFVPLKLENHEYEKGNFNRVLGITIGLGVGSLTGLLGAGGGFILIPLMIYFLKIPLRITIGTSLCIILITSIATMGAKFKVGHIDSLITLLVISGSVAGAWFGSFLSQKTHTKFLRVILIILLFLIFITVGYKTFFDITRV